MIANTNLPLIKTSQKLFAQANDNPQNFKNLRYIPDWFIKREPCGNYSDFMSKMQEHYPNFSLKKLAKFVKKNGEKIGEGREAETYTIPKIDNYIIRIKKKASLGFFSWVKKLKKTPDNYYGFNFGQPIASNNNGISINIKAIGEEYGIKNWIACSQLSKKPIQKEANHFVEHDLALLSEFPQESYDDFIKRASFIKNATPYTFDFVNPNNFIIDYANKKINIVDTSPKDIGNFWDADFNKIPNTLCDESLIFYASPEIRNNASKYIHEIRQKCQIAIDKYQNSYPKIKWENTEKDTFYSKFFKKIKKIFENISQKQRAKHFGNKIENLNALD